LTLVDIKILRGARSKIVSVHQFKMVKHFSSCLSFKRDMTLRWQQRVEKNVFHIIF